MACGRHHDHVRDGTEDGSEGEAKLMRRSPAVSTLVSVALTLVLPCALAAAAGEPSHWLTPTIGLVPNGVSDVSVAARGDLAVAVWNGAGVEASFRRAGGSWEQPVKLTAGYPFFPQVALDANGDALVTLRTSESAGPTSTSRLVGYARPAGSSSWSGPTAISTPSWEIGQHDLALNDAGRGVLAWRAADRPQDYELQVVRAAFRSGDGSWGEQLNLGYTGSSFGDPMAAVDGQGDALVIWARNGQMFAAYRSASGWQPTTVIASDAVEWENYDVVMNRRGDALAVWADTNYTMVSARRPAATGTWSAPMRVPVTNPSQGVSAYYYGLSFALDEQGNAILVEGRDDGQVEALTLPAGAGQWQQPAVIGTSGSDAWYAHDNWCVRPRVALDANGGKLVVWGGSSLYAARRPPGSNSWQVPFVVAADPACFQRSLALDAAGDGVVLFNTGTDTRRLDAAVLDVTPPLVDTLRAPAVAVTDRRIRLTLRAHDLWSRVASVKWRFGDGARARSSGGRAGDTTVATVRHAYHRPGRYAVTVTVTDQASNTARRTLLVRVRAR
jgi:hypothetical protein